MTSDHAAPLPALNGRRVLQLLGPSTGGIRRHVAALRDGLRQQGWEVAVAGPASAWPDDDAGPFHPVPVSRGPQTLVAAARLRPLVADVDLVHAHGITAGWAAVLGARSRPLVVTVHNLVLDGISRRSARWLRRAEGLLPGRAARTIAISDEVARRFTGLPGANRIDVIPPVGPPPVVDEPAATTRAALGVPAGVPLVVLVGRLHPQKDIGTFLAAAARVRRRCPDARFVVVGEGAERGALEAERDRRGLTEAVLFVGPRRHAANEMAAADVVVCSSRWESFGFVVAEALELARPVAATAVGRIPEMVIDGQTGRLVAPRDPVALGDAITDLVTSPTLAARLATAGRDRVRQLFGPEVLVDAVIASYRRALHAP